MKIMKNIIDTFLPCGKVCQFIEKSFNVDSFEPYLLFVHPICHVFLPPSLLGCPLLATLQCAGQTRLLGLGVNAVFILPL